jgi:hypothetical protein
MISRPDFSGEMIVVERRFQGPPDSAHGGNACGAD